MLCNSLDTDATDIQFDVREIDGFHQLTVKDNGTKKLRPDDIRLILDFSNKASSKRGFLRVSRGYLGNALKCVFGFSHALADFQGSTPPEITVESHGLRNRIHLRPDWIEGRIDAKIEVVEIFDDGMNTFIVRAREGKDRQSKVPKEAPRVCQGCKGHRGKKDETDEVLVEGLELHTGGSREDR